MKILRAVFNEAFPSINKTFIRQQDGALGIRL